MEHINSDWYKNTNQIIQTFIDKKDDFPAFKLLEELTKMNDEVDKFDPVDRELYRINFYKKHILPYNHLVH